MLALVYVADQRSDASFKYRVHKQKFTRKSSFFGGEHHHEAPFAILAVNLRGGPLGLVHGVVATLHLVQGAVLKTVEIRDVSPGSSVGVCIRNLDAVVLGDMILACYTGLVERRLPRRMHVLLLAGPRADQGLSLEWSVRSNEAGF